MKYVGMSCVLVACIGMGQYFSVAAIRRIRALEQVLLLLKALGVSVLTQLAADACRDSGETALSNKVELAGKVTILLLCLPLVKAMIQLSAGLIKG